tara:strand:- start:3344 stop:4495 length:1152 start_codon:yes stop_codon:yes gene_type:complete
MSLNWSYVGPDHGQTIYPKNSSEFQRLYTGNTGNLVYYYATRCCIAFSNRKFGFGAKPEIINKIGNGLVFSLANQLGSHTDLGKRGMRLEQLDVPVVGLGLGAQIKEQTEDLSFIPQGTVEWIRQLTERSVSNAPNLTVRGDYTFSILEKLGLADKALPIGCQTNFINPNANLGKTIIDRFNSTGMKKISTAAGSPYNKDFSKLEGSLLNLAINNKGRYIVQHPMDLINVTINYSKEDFKHSFERILPFYQKLGFSEEELVESIENKFRVFVDPTQWMLEHQYSDIVVGTRIHGVQSALQAGVPAVCLYIDSRTKELCEKMKIPHANAKNYLQGITRNDIAEIIADWDYENYDENRLKLSQQFNSFLIDNRIKPSNNLLMLSK